MSEKIYYEPQNQWNADNYYYLHRKLHKILYYFEKYSEEISNMDLSRMSSETKVLMFCIIKYYHNDFMFEKYENLAPLQQVSQLPNKLIIDSDALPEDNVYKRMNVVY